ncbi:MAG: hypothetical protein GQ558_08655 [Thermoplasmata archaeon]|nr:hypothetical protein [Thermoplasmata archaeon]
MAVAPEAGSRAGDDRTSDIDGFHEDEFDLVSNVSLYDNATVDDGMLTLSRAIWEDEFDVPVLAPWVAAEGFPTIRWETLLTNATTESNTTAMHAIDNHDFELLFDFSPGLSLTGGPVIMLKGPGMQALYFRYSDADRKIEMGYVETGMEVKLADGDAILQQDEWYQGKVEIRKDSITFSMGPGVTSATHTFTGNFTKLEFTSLPSDSAAWDNVTFNRHGARGSATTFRVTLPTDTIWQYLTVDIMAPPGTFIEVSVWNASTDLPLPGLDNITDRTTALSKPERATYIDPILTPAIKLHVEMSCTGTDEPTLTSWKVSWIGDPPLFLKAIPQVTLFEDEPKVNVLDLRQYFTDRFTAPEDMIYTVSFSSDDMHVRPVVDEYNLSFELPTRHWYGSEQYRITASDGVLSVESLIAKAVVTSVDDPPIVSPLGERNIKEDEVTKVNLTPYLADVDTPVEFLRVRALSSHVTVDGQVVSILYEEGGISDSIELEVSDFNTAVQVFLDVVVAEVDDPPVFKPIDAVSMNEDQERTVNIASLITDEDTDLEDMVITMPDKDHHVTLDGTFITLLYTTEGGEYHYEVVVSDGNSKVNQTLQVNVMEINDPPVITAVGDLEIVDGKAVLSLVEGDSEDLQFVVEDEESTSFQFTLVTDHDGTTMSRFGGILSIITEVGELGDHLIQVSVSDGGAATMVTIELEVSNRNDPPRDVAVRNPEDGSAVIEGDEVSFSAYAIDPDVTYGDVLSFQWSSSLDGVLSSEKSFTTSTLSQGTHNITVEVTDGEFTVPTSITLVVNKEGGGGGGGGNGNGVDGEGDGISTFLIVGIVAALVIISVAFFFVKNRSIPIAEAPPPPMDLPDRKAEEEELRQPVAKAAPKAEPAPEPEAAPEAGPLKDQAPSPEYSLDYAVAEAPVRQEVSMKYEAVAIDTTLLAETDPEKIRLDNRKREYQAAISQLDFGVPAKELAGMDWYEVAAALATGEQKELDDGRKVTKIDDNWFYSDTEDLKTFLKRHDE